MTSPPSPQDEDAKWQAAVGKAIIRFGDIELISLKCLAHIPQDKIADAAARLEFSRRASLLIELLEARPRLSDPLKGLLDGFKRARELVAKRNLIAHNPVLLDIYVQLGTRDVLTERTIRSARSKTTTLTLEQLQEFADDVANLSSEMWMHFIKAAHDDDPLWRKDPSPAA